MAERLTKKISKIIQDKHSLGSYLYYDFNGAENTNRLLNKLGKLEDIMDDFHISCIDELHERLCWVEEQNKELDKIYAILEKYGTNVNELDNALFQRIVSIDNPFVKGYVQAKIDAVTRAEQDRDTWKRACELACDVLRDINYKIYNEDRIDFENTFYQQAKKEKEG